MATAAATVSTDTKTLLDTTAGTFTVSGESMLLSHEERSEAIDITPNKEHPLLNYIQFVIMKPKSGSHYTIVHFICHSKKAAKALLEAAQISIPEILEAGRPSSSGYTTTDGINFHCRYFFHLSFSANKCTKYKKELVTLLQWVEKNLPYSADLRGDDALALYYFERILNPEAYSSSRLPQELQRMASKNYTLKKQVAQLEAKLKMLQPAQLDKMAVPAPTNASTAATATSSLPQQTSAPVLHQFTSNTPTPLLDPNATTYERNKFIASINPLYLDGLM